jgi:hypothetical protein
MPTVRLSRLHPALRTRPVSSCRPKSARMTLGIHRLILTTPTRKHRGTSQAKPTNHTSQGRAGRYLVSKHGPTQPQCMLVHHRKAIQRTCNRNANLKRDGGDLDREETEKRETYP